MTQNDLKQIGDLMDKKLDKRFGNFEKKIDQMMDVRLGNFEKKVSVLIDVKLDSKLEKLEQKMFEWKSEMMGAVDIFMKEIDKNREFVPIASYRTADNTRRIEKLETKVFGSIEN